MGAVFPLESYSIDNGIQISKEFTRYLHEKGQGIRHSGVGGQHQNLVEYNKIKNLVRISGTMMINAALRCTDASDKILCPMDMAHYVHLQNHTLHISSCLYPEEVWTWSRSYHSALQNDHPWGCPAYFLEPRLQYGNKFPKWMPRSRRAQYLGASHLHASTVSLVRNLQTGNVIPQLYFVIDEYFETVHTGEDKQPPFWS